METEAFSRSLLDGMTLLMRVLLPDLMGYIHRKGISMAQIKVLYHLYYHGPCEVLALSQAFSLSPAGASQLIERMVRQAWVERRDDPVDRRVRRVYLTDAGRAAAPGLPARKSSSLPRCANDWSKKVRHNGKAA